MPRAMQWVEGFAFVIAVMVIATGGLSGQKATPADVAARLTGTWTINRELSTGFSAPGRRGRGGGPSYAVGGALQRGGGRGAGLSGDGPSGPEDLTPEERAALAAMRQLQQIAPEITIKATPDSVTFVDQRGEQAFTVNDKRSTIDVAGARIAVKSKWDRQTLRQEFSSTRSKLIRTWDVDDSARLVLKVKVEGMSMVSEEVRAVFDRSGPADAGHYEFNGAR
jgi:hypothetical protein